MEVLSNELGGQSVFLKAGDELAQVPESFQPLISPNIREAFRCPKERFELMARSCPFPEMAAWLENVIVSDNWRLELHQSFEHCSAGFRWRHRGIISAMVAFPGDAPRATLPSTLQTYYSLVDVVRWTEFGWGGCLEGVNDHSPLSIYPVTYHGADIDPVRTFMWGGTDCGEKLIFTSDGRGGWMNNGSHKIHLLGSISDTINWVFAEMCANRVPFWDYDNWN